MLDRIFDFLSNLVTDLVPLFTVKAYEEGVVLRAGPFKKIVKPGIYFKIPFIDEVIKDCVTTTTLTLPAQSLTTNDGVAVVVKGMIKYRITEIKVFLLDVSDVRDALSDTTQGVIAGLVTSNKWADLQTQEIDNTITKKARVKAKKYGIEIEEVTLTDKTATRSIRLFNESSIFN